MEPFLIENKGNTCYIDSLLIALFYDHSHIENILNKYLQNPLGIYLQEFIKEKFINTVRANKSIVYNDIEMIYTLCVQLDWKNHNVCDFYAFLMELFESDPIKIKKFTCSEELSDKVIPFITLPIPENKINVKVSELIHDWLHDTQILDTCYVDNMPQIIGLSINRISNKNNIIKTNVIIQKKISLYNQEIINNTKWDFHAAICQKITGTGEHYYTLIMSNNKWYIFDDIAIPCMYEVRMDDKYITDMVKKECIFLLYKLPKYYHR